MISGFATSEGTKKFVSNSGVNLQNFKNFANLSFSNVGIGTYLGDADSKTDELVNIFDQASMQEKRKAYNLLVELNPNKTDLYSKIIK